MSYQSNATSSIIILVVLLAAVVGILTYTLTRRSIEGYQLSQPRVAIPAPAKPPGF